MSHAEFPSPLPSWLATTPIASAASNIYKSIISARNRRYDNPGSSFKASRPVISIGGIRAGGTGKTPSAIFVGGYLSNLGYTPVYLTRGYRRTSKELQIVKPDQKISWELIGDEPSMIHSILPQSWLGVHPNRIQSALALEGSIPQKSVFILDDGFQHRQIARDLDIVCLHESTINEKLLPQGYLREPISSLSRADAAFLIGNQKKTLYLKQWLSEHFPELELFELEFKPQCYIHAQTGNVARKPSCGSAVALSGIARPERFFESLRDDEIEICKEIAFPDHYRFKVEDIISIRKLYSKELITTEKDAIRLVNDNIVPDQNFWYLRMSLDFCNTGSFKRFETIIKNKIQ